MTGKGWVASKGIGVRDCRTELTQTMELLTSQLGSGGCGNPNGQFLYRPPGQSVFLGHFYKVLAL